MQVAICTDGQLYCSLSQVNTDAKVFCAFMSRLAAKLTEEDREWRQNSILLIDGARYQTCKESVTHMAALGFNVCISGPYSFASAPIEYCFGAFKSVALNPRGLKTGKK